MTVSAAVYLHAQMTPPIIPRAALSTPRDSLHADA